MIFQHFLVKVDMQIEEVNSFILGCDETKEAILVDAGKLDEAFTAFVEKHDLNVTTIFMTHEHPDHAAGVGPCAKHFDAKIVSGVKSSGGVSADRVVAHGDEVRVGNLVGHAVSTPGHTPVGMSLVFPGMVFTGDALFAGSVGGTSSKADYDLQIDQIRKHLLSLPPETEIHPGHGPPTTVGIESQYSPFFV